MDNITSRFILSPRGEQGSLICKYFFDNIRKGRRVSDFVALEEYYYFEGCVHISLVFVPASALERVFELAKVNTVGDDIVQEELSYSVLGRCCYSPNEAATKVSQRMLDSLTA